MRRLERTLCIVDGVEGGFLGRVWRTWMQVPRFDLAVAVPSWDAALRVLEEHAPTPRFFDVQVWGHGRPAEPLIAGRPCPYQDTRWALAREVWFRSCSVMAGREGRSFAEALAGHGCDVAGHTRIIGSWGMHSGLVGLRASELDQGAWWSTDAGEAVEESRPWAPRTVPATQMRCPSWAYEASA